MTTLTNYDAARTALAKAVDIDEVRAIRDKSEALRAYARQTGECLESQNKWAEIKIRAERRAGELLAERDMAKGGGDTTGDTVSPVVGQPPTLKAIGVSPKQSSRWQQAASVPEDVFEEHVAETKAKGEELTSAGVQTIAKKRKAKQVRQDRIEAIVEQSTASSSPGGGTLYPVLLADPPWRYEHAVSTSREIEKQYPTMALDEIKALKVPASDSAVLYLWATSPKLAEALEVMEAWQFVYKTCLVWVKDRIGMGYWVRQRHELLLIGVRGDMPPPPPEARPDSVIEAPRLEHSSKPPCVLGLVERAFPGIPKIELFARQQHPGWASWGHEA